MKVYQVRIEHGGSDSLSHHLHWMHGLTGVIQLLMAAAEKPNLYRFTVQEMDDGNDEPTE